MEFGCAWYPEHWPESRWPEDLRLMREARMSFVRMAEFAWSRIEPEEGRFELEWLERAVEAASAVGLRVVLGTPTASPPMWLVQKYPEVLAVGPSGLRRRPGSRSHYSPASERYRQHCRRAAEAMARRFGKHPAVLGWQIDNEYKSLSHDDDTRAQFQRWLAERHGTLEAMNRRFSLAYWSQEYTDWSQIPLPVPSADPFPDDWHHPSLKLEWRRFQTEMWRSYQAVQVETLRAHIDPRQWITHNFMGFFDGFDHYRLAADLDLVSWDSYVVGAQLDPHRTGAAHDLMRGLKRRNFWLMEMQPGPLNWRPVNGTPGPGEIRVMAWHAVGHGADAVSFWQWRSALGGQEQYFGTIMGPDGSPRPVFGEICALGAELERAAPFLDGTGPAPEVGLLHSYDSRWALDLQRHHEGFDPVAQLVEWYRPLRALGLDVEIVAPEAILDGLRLVVAPSLHIATTELAATLAEFVRRGGHLVLGPRSGMKDLDDALHPMRPPGPLAALAPATVTEFYALEQPVRVAGPAGTGEAHVWAEWLQPISGSCEVLLRYDQPGGWLDGKVACATHALGAGRVTMLGAWLDGPLMSALLAELASRAGAIPPFGPPPPGVEFCRRVAQERRSREVLVALNHGEEGRTISPGRRGRDALTGASQERFELPPRGIAVVVFEC